jgi:hypothetical protein
MPVVINGRALCPSLVFNTPGAGGFGVGISGAGAAGAFGKSAKQTTADRIAVNIVFRFFII